MNEFKNYHPIVNFTYFAFVIVFSMVFMNPVCLAVSFVSGFVYSLMLGGVRTLKFNLIYLLPLIIITACINPAFNHEGATILCYLPSQNPLTLESVVYGAAAAVMLAGVICHFSCFNKIMTSDKFIYLLGKILPSLSLVLSMILRFVPRFSSRIKETAASRRCLLQNSADMNIKERIKNSVDILSGTITWSMENSIVTADSMRARGYGTGKRTFFSNFKFDARDRAALAVIITLAAYIITGAALGVMYFGYFPSITVSEPTPYGMSVMAAYFMLFMLPVVIEIKEAVRWKRLRSGI